MDPAVEVFFWIFDDIWLMLYAMVAHGIQHRLAPPLVHRRGGGCGCQSMHWGSGGSVPAASCVEKPHAQRGHNKVLWSSPRCRLVAPIESASLICDLETWWGLSGVCSASLIGSITRMVNSSRFSYSGRKGTKTVMVS
ncbi:hypothetical protein YC2023_088753 [Brassica napus]